jgi:hypothetical protein
MPLRAQLNSKQLANVVAIAATLFVAASCGSSAQTGLGDGVGDDASVSPSSSSGGSGSGGSGGNASSSSGSSSGSSSSGGSSSSSSSGSGADAEVDSAASDGAPGNAEASAGPDAEVDSAASDGSPGNAEASVGADAEVDSATSDGSPGNAEASVGADAEVDSAASDSAASDGTASPVCEAGAASCTSAGSCPSPSTLCLTSTCATGCCGTASAPLRTACADMGGSVCDGNGKCVVCTMASDCPATGTACSIPTCTAQHTCVPTAASAGTACTDNGGLACNSSGSCIGVGLGQTCSVDSNCLSNACDADTLKCTGNQCGDHRKDGMETDVDCGGGVCPACTTSKKCMADSDCASDACDADSLTCVTNQCADHRQDGNESDVDCGGLCASCAVGKMCNTSFDCQAGHFCTTATPHVCQ